MNRISHRLSYFALVAAMATGCTDEQTKTPAVVDPLRIAVLMPIPSDSQTSGLPNMEWALENINAAGGVAGKPLALDYIEPNIADIAAQGEALANDEDHIAVVGPPGSAMLAAVADAFVDSNKPIVSTTSTSDDLLRAYGGRGPVWRTRESDIAQTELLIRFAQGNNAKRITLLTSLDVSGYTFFSWFGFFAREVGYADDVVNIVTLETNSPCTAAVVKALETKPDMLFVAPNAPQELECIVKSLPPEGMPRPRIVFADTGLDPYDLTNSALAAQGLEGFTAAGDEAFEAAYLERFPNTRLSPHGPSEYDALLLLAYGLEISGGLGRKLLVSGMKTAVDGRETNASGWEREGIEATLGAIRVGKKPQLNGATGKLEFEPELYMDLASSTLAHYTVEPQGLVLDQRFSTADPTFLTNNGAFVKPTVALPDVDQSTWTPAVDKTDTWAMIVALSSGWSNYRHQADALQQYRILKNNGVDDDHIILILADDIAGDPSNKQKGAVRNEPSGQDVYGGAVIDYGISVTAEDLRNIMTGIVTPTTPKVISPTASSNVYLYFAGHGGTEGIPLDARTAEDGLSGQGDVFSPTDLRESLCTMQTNGSFRRVFVVVESCYSGVFGDAAYGGIEFGCGINAGDVALDGVVLVTAANGKEVSYAGAYDGDVPAWVNDGFSRQFSNQVEVSLDRSLADVFADAYRATAGSHPSIFNVAHAGRLSNVNMHEMFTP